MSKSILIFGAGYNQYQLIRASKDLGITTVVIDPNSDAPGKEIADYFYVVEGNDYATTKTIALKHKVDGLATTQMEKPMRMMAMLAQDIGLRYHSPEVVERATDKWLMKQAFLNGNVPCAKGKLFSRDVDISKNDLIDLSFPLIIKPRNATSSQGVFKLESFSDIKKYRDITKKFSKNEEIILEEFLEGPEVSIETITYNGVTTIIQFTDKFITPFPTTVEMGHLQPASLTNKQKQEITEVVICTIDSLGIDNSAAHTEVKLTSQGPKIVEIGARGGGDFISSYLTEASTGISMDRAIILVALGQKPELIQKYNNYSFIKYFELPIGKKIAKVDNWSDLVENEDVIIANIQIKEGDIVEPITESKKRPGFLIVKGKNRQDVFDKAIFFEEILKQKIKMDKR